VEYQEALERIAIVCEGSVSVLNSPQPLAILRTRDTAHPVNDIVDHFFANSVMPSGIIVGSIFLPANEELGVEELAVTASTNLIDRRRVQINED
jgi:hypothetical protein